MSDYTELKRLAEAATQCSGPRRVVTNCNGVPLVLGDGSWKILSAWHTPDGKGLENAKFAAAASPASVLALIAENEALRRDAERYRLLRTHAFLDIDETSPVWGGRPPLGIQIPWRSDGSISPDKGRDCDVAVDEAMCNGERS